MALAKLDAPRRANARKDFTRRDWPGLLPFSQRRPHERCICIRIKLLKPNDMADASWKP